MEAPQPLTSSSIQPPTAGTQNRSLPHHHSQAKPTTPNPGPPDSHATLKVTHAENVDSLPIAGHPQEMPKTSALLQYMATALLGRYLKEQRFSDLAVSIDILEVAKGLPTSSHLHRSNTFNALAVGWFIRYRRSRKESDLLQAIAVHQEALDFLRPDEPAHSSSLETVRSAALIWCEQHGGEPDAIGVRHEAHGLQSPGYPSQFPEEQFQTIGSSPSNGPQEPTPQATAFLLGAAVSCLKQYQREGGPAVLTKAIQLFQEGLWHLPPNSPSRTSTLSNLASAIPTRYERYGGERDLSEAISLNREVLSLQPPGHHDRSFSLTNLASAVTTRYDRDGGKGDLSEAIMLHQEAVSLFALDDPNRSIPLGNLAGTVIRQYRRDGKEQDLSEAITLYREALSFLSPGHPNRSTLLNSLAGALTSRFEQHGAKRDLSEVITLSREALSLRPLGHPGRSASLSILAGAFAARCDWEGMGRDLLEAITLHREALSLRPPGHPDRSASLNNLAGVVARQYEREGGRQELSEAITLSREALFLRPPGHPDRAASLTNLAGVVTRRYKRDGEEQDLSEAITLNREALSLRPSGHPQRSSSLSNLAGTVTLRYERYGREGDVSEVILLHREALSLRPPGHPDRSASLTNLAGVVAGRCKWEGRDGELSEAIALNREALSLWPPGHPNRSASLNNLAGAVTTRYERNGEARNLSEAITLYREALSFFPLGHPDRSVSLDNLAAKIITRYERNGEERDLSEAITLHREALSLLLPGHPDNSASLSNLARAVTKRYERDGGESDLSEAITLNREALSLRPPGHPHRPASLNNLAIAVTTKYERDNEEQDLSEAIVLHREALSLGSLDGPGRSISLNSLAGALTRKYERDGLELDLSEAITLHREALSLRPPGHPHRSASMYNLACVVTTRYKRYGGEWDLSEAIPLHREALSLRPPDDPDRSSSLNALATALFMRHLKTREDQNGSLMEEIIQLLRDASTARTSPIPVRLQAALDWIEIAVKNNPKSALEAYQSAFAHLGSTLALGLSLQARHTNLLSRTMRSQPPKNLALNAALWALTGPSMDPKLAIELLDQGRNVLLASVGQFRADLSNVRQNDPTLAEDFYRVSRVLESAILTGQEISEGKSPHEDPTSRYRRTSTEWEAIVAKIRHLPNCESFLLPVPYIKLQEAAVDGPVIVIVVGKERSTAIIIMPQGEPHTVDLPAASEEALKTLHRDMDAELGAPVRPDMRDVLSDLWKIVVQPIIQELQDVLLIPTGSRIWWYPTSWASFLPLHAAGSYTKGGLNVPKLYISSYTPTLQALRRSQHRFTPGSDRTTSPLIVSQAQTPGQVALPSVDDEVGIVFSLVPNASLLSDDQGTKSNVLRELHNHSWIHLSCHGVLDPSDPFKSHFALHDGPLSLQDIITNDLPSADFAYLAACHSAAHDQTLPDEGLTLAGGMQFAGFKGVVGTLWGMADQDAPMLAEEFYKGLAMKSGEGNPFDCTKAAESLHDAVIELRKQKVPMFRWINLVHYGI